MANLTVWADLAPKLAHFWPWEAQSLPQFRNNESIYWLLNSIWGQLSPVLSPTINHLVGVRGFVLHADQDSGFCVVSRLLLRFGPCEVTARAEVRPGEKVVGLNPGPWLFGRFQAFSLCVASQKDALFS